MGRRRVEGEEARKATPVGERKGKEGRRMLSLKRGVPVE